MKLSRSISFVAGLGLALTTVVGAGATAQADDSDLEPHHTFTMTIDAATGAVAVPDSGEEHPQHRTR